MVALTTSRLLGDRLAAERPRLIGLCAHLTGERAIAEDLAQEVLLEAWHHADRLTDPTGLAPWLSAIARNVCRRWCRARWRGQALTASRALPPDMIADGDLTAGLAQRELTALLDQALSALPEATRSALLAHHIAGVSQASLATRLGIREATLKVRLHRARRALRQQLAAGLGPAASEWGLTTAPVDEGAETRIWCPRCGARRLLGHFVTPLGQFALRCPGCRADVFSAERPALFDGLVGYRAALTRLTIAADAYYQAAVAAGSAPCARCGRPQAVRYLPLDDAATAHERCVSIRCPDCGAQSHQSLAGLALARPAGRAFWRAHPRLVAAPLRAVERDGRATLVVTLRSVDGRAGLDTLLARDTYRQMPGVDDTDG